MGQLKYVVIICVLVHQVYLNETPVNQVVTYGSSVTFTCTAALPTDEIYWMFYGYGASHINCSIYAPSSSFVSDCPNNARYIVTERFGQCNLTINSTVYSDAGTYSCVNRRSGISSRASAQLGVTDEPRIHANGSNLCLQEGDTHEIYCAVTYYGSMPLSVTWRSSSGQETKGNYTYESYGWTMSFLWLTATAPLVYPHTCIISFGAPTSSIISTATPFPTTTTNTSPGRNTVTLGSTPNSSTTPVRATTPAVISLPLSSSSTVVPAGATSAENAPSYIKVLTSAAYDVQHCPVSVTISQVDQRNVICTASAYPYPLYIWTNLTDNSTIQGQRLVPTYPGSFNVSCTAINNITNCYGITRTCTGVGYALLTISVVTGSNPPASPAWSTPSTTVGPPAIDNIYPRRHIISGGTTVFVSGRNFKQINKTELIITMIYTHRYISNASILQQESTNFTSKPCAVSNDTLITCTVPLIVLPEEFRNVNDSNVTFPFDTAARKKRSPDAEMGHYVRTVSGNRLFGSFPVSPSSVHRVKRLISSYTDRNSSLDFYWQVSFDGAVYPWNLSNELQLVSLKPEITQSGDLKLFNPSSSTVIGIKGRYLIRGVTVARDYTVELGDGRCQPQGQLTDNEFFCQPPHSKPNSSDTDRQYCRSGDFVLMVKVGGGSVPLGSAGCLRYVYNDDKDLIIIIVCSVGGALIISLFIAISSAVYHRKYKGQQTDDDDDNIELNQQDPATHRQLEYNKPGYSRNIDDVRGHYPNHY